VKESTGMTRFPSKWAHDGRNNVTTSFYLMILACNPEEFGELRSIKLHHSPMLVHPVMVNVLICVEQSSLLIRDR
jgi:hypothetical protein